MIVLIGIAVILAAYTWRGYKKGLVRILLQLCSTLAAVLLAAFLCGPVSGFIGDHTPFYDAVKAQTEKFVKNAEGVREADADTEVTEDVSAFEQAEIAVMEALHLPQNIQDSILAVDVGKYLNTGVSAVNELIVAALADFIFTAIVFVVLFVVILVILRVVIRLTDVINLIPIIGSMNHLAGLAAGAVYGILVVWLAFVVVSMFGNQEWAQYITASVNSNPVTEFIYNSNLIMKYIGRL